jgi:alkylation response protein AidB-like acyl-CoA dehydrogenase
MDFKLTMEQEMLRDSVRDFAETDIKPLAQELDEKEEFSYKTMEMMAGLGLFGMFVSPEYGGQGMDYISYIIACEEMARVDGSHAATVVAENSLGIGPLYYFANEEQKKKYLPKLCAGEALWGFGLTEPNAGSDAGNAKTTAVLDGNEWVINGSKIFITNAGTDITIGSTVLCRTGTRDNGSPELSCIIVENGTPGFTTKVMHGKMMWRASNTAELYFEDCRVPKDNLVGPIGNGFYQMMQTLDGGRLSIGAMGLGGAQGCFDMALKYSNEREQFGQPISKFQVNAFKLADMAMEIECARLLLYKACWLRQNNEPFSKIAAMAKLYCSEVMSRCADQAVQLFGGYGLMKEYDIERFYRDQKLLEIGEGTSEVQRLVISRLVGA